MTKEEKSTKILQAEEKVRQAKAQLAKAKQEARNKIRKEQDHHKYMMGGVIVKYFPEAYDFSEHEMNRIIACAFSLRDVKNMVATVVRERPVPEAISDDDGGLNENEDDAEYDDDDSEDPEGGAA